jgi:cation transport protein ChaC
MSRVNRDISNHLIEENGLRKPESDPRGREDAPPPRFWITRERLRDVEHLRRMRENALPQMRLRSDEELAASLAETLAGRRPGDALWLFGYGSLIWNPAFLFAEQQVALIHGWHRRFCLSMESGRGSPEQPGLMLALDRGGSCRGVAYRIAEDQVDEEMLLVWRREMLSGVYHARWVEAATAQGPVRAITFTANRRHDRFITLPDDEVAERVATARGAIGSCAEYLSETVAHLEALGFRDASLERIRARIAARGGPGAPAHCTGGTKSL